MTKLREKKMKILHKPAVLSCNTCLDDVKNGLSDGFGVEPIDMLSISCPDSSPSPHERESSSWNNASRSRSPLNVA